jgi:DnaA family protein
VTTPQLPLALRYPPDQRFETYVAAPAGALAQLRALAQVANADWLYLAGPAGVGKYPSRIGGVCGGRGGRAAQLAFLP